MVRRLNHQLPERTVGTSAYFALRHMDVKIATIYITKMNTQANIIVAPTNFLVNKNTNDVMEGTLCQARGGEDVHFRR